MATCSSIIAWKIPCTEEPGAVVQTVAESDTTKQLSTHENEELILSWPQSLDPDGYLTHSFPSILPMQTLSYYLCIHFLCTANLPCANWHCVEPGSLLNVNFHSVILFYGICSAFKCSFDEFVGEKVVSPSYSSAILGPPPSYYSNSPFSSGFFFPIWNIASTYSVFFSQLPLTPCSSGCRWEDSPWEWPYQTAQRRSTPQGILKLVWDSGGKQIRRRSSLQQHGRSRWRSFPSAWGGADAQDGGDNTSTRKDYWEEGPKPRHQAGTQKDYQVDGDIRPGQREERGHLAAVAANGMVLTEVQVSSFEDIDKSFQETQAPWAPHKLHTQLFLHHLSVKQRVADGGIAVIGHCWEQTGFSPCSDKHKEALS